MRAWRSNAWRRIGSRINPNYRPMGNAEKSLSSSAENPSLLAGRNWLKRLLVSFIATRTPKCREVVKLLSQSMEVKLPVTTRIKIRFHYLICIWCYRYGKQLHALRKLPHRYQGTWTTALGRLYRTHQKNG